MSGEVVRGRDVRMWRIRAGLSQIELAKRLEVHQALISAMETETLGEIVSPDFAERVLVACEAGAAA